jgi:hypothetical protein
MPIKLPFEANQAIAGEASVCIEKPSEDVFHFIADHFFENYPKWSPDVVELEPLESPEVAVGIKAKQVREDNGSRVESVFEIVDYAPYQRFKFEGLNAPYRHTYTLEEKPVDKLTELTFCFELLELDVFMRPFQKLIRIAIEDGAENTVNSIKTLLT